MSRLGHLARRFRTSLSPAAPPAADVEWALSNLLPDEAALWERMSVQDRRHSILVARRFASGVVDAPRAAMAAALLHDVGKVECGLGTWMRVVATVVGPRTARLRSYHDHERIGAELLQAAGSSPVTVELVLGRGPLAEALRSADDV